MVPDPRGDAGVDHSLRRTRIFTGPGNRLPTLRPTHRTDHGLPARNGRPDCRRAAPFSDRNQQSSQYAEAGLRCARSLRTHRRSQPNLPGRCHRGTRNPCRRIRKTSRQTPVRKRRLACRRRAGTRTGYSRLGSYPTRGPATKGPTRSGPRQPENPSERRTSKKRSSATGKRRRRIPQATAGNYL